MTLLRKSSQWLLPVLITAAVFALLLGRKDVSLSGLLEAVGSKESMRLIPALLVYGGVSLLLEALTLTRITNSAGGRLPIWTAARVKAASYLAYTIHYTVGVAALSTLLRRRAALPLSGAAGVVLTIATLDLVLILVLTTTGSVALGVETAALRVGVIGVLGLLLLAGLAVLRTPVSLGPLERVRSLAILRSARELPVQTILELALLRLGFVLLFVSLGGVALESFGITVPATAVLVNICLVALVAALPIAVAGLGTGQAAFVYAFRDFSDAETLLACSVALSAGLILLRVGLGILFACEYTREALAAVRAKAEEGA